MSEYKLHYFNGRGVAEPARLLFALAGVEYEDVRCEEEDWPAKKPQMPLGALPVLEIDGKMITQSQAIVRYLAREYGFYGANNMEAFRIDEIHEAVVELHQELYKVRVEKDDTKKMTLADVLVYNITFNMEYYLKLSLEKWPKTTAVCKKVENHPKISAWLKERPVTDF